MPEKIEASSATLRATYNSPSGPTDFQHVIIAPTPDNVGSIDTQAKMIYLSELRASSKMLQEEINQFLTDKMEEDKRAAGQENTSETSKQKTKDELEEENYGEEAEDDT
ncbi:uncharacterized protein Z518_02140 [Rhinocladiella mackenziei CBS 650.93]|uniref:EKC/KEOPS complex subunit GON7 n=1 Tax=Rhinocladiella mackenziei CBS 650.93 TaxID=1442369 RepID=A0A0D2FYZ4_9EURO|nr:uncharacterized protein Z518_02140 [Rhinocladiella mackenziei CBS 650.93]KIX07487.1 hypothetical protein Z518_02140 [Rhinocladiella mackenziei CBS 650.93]